MSAEWQPGFRAQADQTAVWVIIQIYGVLWHSNPLHWTGGVLHPSTQAHTCTQAQTCEHTRMHSHSHTLSPHYQFELCPLLAIHPSLPPFLLSPSLSVSLLLLSQPPFLSCLPPPSDTHQPVMNHSSSALLQALPPRWPLNPTGVQCSINKQSAHIFMPSTMKLHDYDKKNICNKESLRNAYK